MFGIKVGKKKKEGETRNGSPSWQTTARLIGRGGGWQGGASPFFFSFFFQKTNPAPARRDCFWNTPLPSGVTNGEYCF
jgi:hypothetical protein